jgi:hypothetical protein
MDLLGLMEMFALGSAIRSTPSPINWGEGASAGPNQSDINFGNGDNAVAC